MSSDNYSRYELQPGLLNIRPVPVGESSVEEPENSEIRKIARDVVNAMKYGFTAAVAHPEHARAGTAEAEFAEIIRKLEAIRPDLVQVARAEAEALASASEHVRSSIFGRFGQIPADAFVSNGASRILEDAGVPQLNYKLLGFDPPSVSIPPEVLDSVEGIDGLLIPSDTLPKRNGEILAPGDFQAAVAESLQRAADNAVFDQDRMASIWGQWTNYDPYNDEAPESDFAPQAAATKLDIYVRRIKCEDETNPEPWGDDEIALGGISTDENGDVKKIPESPKWSGFHDGKSKTFSNWSFHSFNLTEGNFWPKKYGVTFVLAEKDDGGLADYLNKLWANVKVQVKAAIEKALEAAGAAVGGMLGAAEIGQIIGKVLGKVVAWVVDELVGWLINLFKDDIFKPYTAWLTLPSAHARWNYPNGIWGNPWSGIQRVRFSGFGGRYLLEYQWRLHS